MARKRLLWQLYPSYLLVGVVVLLSAGWYAAHLLERAYIDSLDQRLQLATRLVDRAIGPSLVGEDIDALRATCDSIAAETSAHLAVLSPAGEVVIESGPRLAAVNADSSPRGFAAA